MHFRTRAAGAGFAHFPKVVFFIAGEDVVFVYILFPQFVGFGIFFQAFLFVAFKIGYVQAVLSSL
jgi:hypothetical protein